MRNLLLIRKNFAKRTLYLVMFVYACIVLANSFAPKYEAGENAIVVRLYNRANLLQTITDPIKRDSFCHPFSDTCRYIEKQIPMGVKIFLPGMLGEVRDQLHGYYYLLTYYLFPREVNISAGKPAIRRDGWEGREPESLEELASLGYHLVIYFQGHDMVIRQLLPFPKNNKPHESQKYNLIDPYIAFIIPILFGVFGISLMNFLFNSLYGRMNIGEKFACGFALGSLFISQFVLATRLLGLRIERVICYFLLVWLIIKAYQIIQKKNMIKFFKYNRLKDLSILFYIPLGVLFFILFKLAGLEGLLERDAITSWVFRAKIFHLFTGDEMIQWFSKPGLGGFAHFEYPTLVPILHAFTFGVIGHVNEFVTKYWSVWMFLSVIFGVYSICSYKNNESKRVLILSLIVSITFLPKMIGHIRSEGGTIPMLMFITVGLMQYAVAVRESDKERLLLSLLILFGGAMTKMEGRIALLLAPFLLILRKDTRSLIVKGDNHKLLLVTFIAVFVSIPYIILQLKIPVLHPVASWIDLIVESPIDILKNYPKVFFVLLTRRFLNNDFASWISTDGSNMIWNGQWEGLVSLINQPMLGITWIFTIITIIALRKDKNIRVIVIFLGTILLFHFLFFALILTSWPVCIENIQIAFEDTSTHHWGRVAFPFIIAWGVGIFVLLCRRHD